VDDASHQLHHQLFHHWRSVWFKQKDLLLLHKSSETALQQYTEKLDPRGQYEIRIATSSRYHTHYSHLGPRFRLRKFSLTSCGCGYRNHIFVADKEWRAVILKIMWELQFLHNLYLDVFGYFFSSEEPKLHTVFCTVYQSAIGWDRQWHKMTSVKVI